MKIVGLTGSFGTGKTFVASIFASLGAKVLDADSIAHDMIERGKPAYKRVVAVFGSRVIEGARGKGHPSTSLGTRGLRINRKKLGKIVFSDKNALKRLNAIIHPYVIKEIMAQVKKARDSDMVVIDAPLLIEAGMAGAIDVLVVVKASRETQIARCMKAFGLSRADVLKRIGSQIPMKEKTELADFVIDNDDGRSETRKQARKVWRKIAWR